MFTRNRNSAWFVSVGGLLSYSLSFKVRTKYRPRFTDWSGLTLPVTLFNTWLYGMVEGTIMFLSLLRVQKTRSSLRWRIGETGNGAKRPASIAPWLQLKLVAQIWVCKTSGVSSLKFNLAALHNLYVERFWAGSMCIRAGLPNWSITPTGFIQ